MASDLTVYSTGAIDAYMSGDVSVLDNQLDKEGAGSEVTGYLQFSGKTGLFKVKDDIISVPSLWAFLVNEARAQWVGWEGGKVKDRHSAPILAGGFDLLPAEHELEPIHGNGPTDGWQRTIAMPVRDMEGEYDQLEITLNASDGKRPVWGLIRAWHQNQKFHATAETPLFIPIVEIDSDEFKTKYGTAFKPILKIEEFRTPEELADITSSDAEVEDEAPPPPKPKGPAKFQSARRGGRTA